MIMGEQSSPDLLSAALDQSGLTNCDVKSSDAIGLRRHFSMEKRDVKISASSPRDLTATTSRPRLLVRSAVSNTSANSSNANIIASTVISTISSPSYVTASKLSTIPNARVIKLPLFKTGSVIKIKKIPSSNMLHLNGSPSSSTPVLNLSDSSISTINKEANQLNSNGHKFGKLIASGKAVFIPISKAQVTKMDKQPSIKSIQTMQRSSPLPTTVEIESCDSTLVQSVPPTNPRSNIPKVSSASSGLNLGSMFVESAEKAVDSEFNTPPCSPFTLVLSDENSKRDNKNKVLIKSTFNDPQRDGGIEACSSSRKPQLSRLPSTPTIRLSMNKSVDQSLSDKTREDAKNVIPRTASLPLMRMQEGEELVAEDEKDEEIHHAHTYAEYMPSKLKIGLPHPDSVVETSSLASIIPPHVHYHLALPNETIMLGKLSALQLESIVYACQKHETFLPSGERAGYLIGDGAGVGKGRSVAGIIYENYLVGRKRALWFSVSNDLKYDAERDLRDIGAKHIKVYSLNKFKYGKITSKINGAVKKGVIFATYSSLIGESHSQAKYRTRLKQILHWCGEEFDGPIIFDECHKAKNLVPSGAGKSTKTGITVLDLQNKLPNARVVYASATGASEPRNMAYMSRLGLWGLGTPFENFMEFIQVVERRGVGAMELVAMDMKLRGNYIARQLSFYGVSFKIEEVRLDSDFINMYNKSVRLWVGAREAFQMAATMMEAEYHMMKSMWAQFWAAHQRFFKYLCMSAKVNRTVSLVREAVKHGKCVVIGLQSTGEAGTVDQLEKSGGELNDFVSTAKAVFENLVERHFPAPDRRRVTTLLGRNFYEKPDQDKVVIKSRKRNNDEQSPPPTKRSRRNSASSDEWSESDDDAMFHSDGSHLSEEEDIKKIFGDTTDSDECESPVKKEANKKVRSCDEEEEDGGLKMKDDEAPGLLSSLLVSGTLPSSLPGLGRVEKAQALKKELLTHLERLGPFLPNNMLDELIDALGGTENVAEMTGRKGRVVSTDEGEVRYKRRAEEDIPMELLNMREKQRFMDGEKNIAIISEAASSGISLQADKRARNQRKRVHVTVELPWSADRAVQQFGRTHRSNQANAPEYVFLITELAGEQRFASVVAKRLESLGALTHGDRRATESRDFSKYNYDNKYGKKALDKVMKSIAGFDSPLVPPPSSYKGNFFEDIRLGLLGVGLLTRENGQLNYQLDKDYLNIFKFMNRILGMEVGQQNAIFTFFSDTLNAIIGEAKRLGEYDLGIMDVGASNNSVERMKSRDFPLSAGAKVTLHTVRVGRGASWEDAKRIHGVCSAEGDSGFYIALQKRNNRCMVMLATDCSTRRNRNLFSIFRPNTGKQQRRETKDEIVKKYARAEMEEAEKWWTQHYDASLDQCSHQYWQGSCSRGALAACHVGKRRRMYHVVSGSVLQVWRTVERVLTRDGGFKYKMQIVRLKTSDGGKLVGLLIPSTCVMGLTDALCESASQEVQPPSRSSPCIDPLQVNVVTSDEDSDEYEEVGEFDPDHVSSTVLFSKKDFAFS